MAFETRFALLGGNLAAAAMVSLIPVFWRGKTWQAPIAEDLVPSDNPSAG